MARRRSEEDVVSPVPDQATQVEEASESESAAETSKKCPITRKEFMSGARPLNVTIDGQRLAANIREFSSGSFGWGLNDKVIVEVDGIPVRVQCGLNLTIVGSKEAE